MTYNATAIAINKMLRVSPRKLNLIATKIRGMHVDKALTYLAFCEKRSAVDVRQTLLSAVSNAENNHGMDIDQLFVKEAYVGQGTKMRRFQARAKGRGAPISKYFSHLSIVVEEKEV
jgi:large subunit ribosomal protein L22